MDRTAAMRCLSMLLMRAGMPAQLRAVEIGGEDFNRFGNSVVAQVSPELGSAQGRVDGHLVPVAQRSAQIAPPRFGGCPARGMVRARPSKWNGAAFDRSDAALRIPAGLAAHASAARSGHRNEKGPEIGMPAGPFPWSAGYPVRS